MYRSVARMGICWADMGIWSEYFLKSPKRELVLGRKAMEDFHTPNTYQKSQKTRQIIRKISDWETCRGQR